MVLDEIFQALLNANRDDTAYGISEQMRRELTKTAPECECWDVYGTDAYELIRLIGQNVKWKLNYPGISNYALLLNAARDVDKLLDQVQRPPVGGSGS